MRGYIFSSPEQLLSEAIQKQDLAEIERILKSGTVKDLNITPSYSITRAIVIASHAKYIYSCNTFLEQAIRTKNIQAVQLLLDYGADINLLHKHEEISSGSIYSPISYSINECSDYHTTEYLLTRNPNISTLVESNTIHHALDSIPPIAKLITTFYTKNKISLNTANTYGLFPLDIAVRNGYLNITKTLLENGARPAKHENITYKNWPPILISAVQHLSIDPKFKLPAILLQFSEVDPNAQDSAGNTAAHHATLGRHISTIALLHKHSANLDTPNLRGETPLHLAAQHKRHGIIRELLKFGANPNLPDINGNTPLHIAAKNHDSTSLMLLRKHGANPQLKNCDNLAVTDIVKSDEMQEALAKNYPIINTHQSLNITSRPLCLPIDQSSLTQEQQDKNNGAALLTPLFAVIFVLSLPLILFLAKKASASFRGAYKKNDDLISNDIEEDISLLRENKGTEINDPTKTDDLEQNSSNSTDRYRLPTKTSREL